jgi:hypothetical protein
LAGIPAGSGTWQGAWRAGVAPPPPPKVFCVGWQKTGTKSINLALRFLGYRGASWNPELFYRWHEGKAEKLIAASYLADAFDDLPWTLAFRELDAAHPDAKFVLTTRPADAWLPSLQSHIARSPRWVGHYLIYGSYDPVADADRHLAVYLAHNEAVRDYFRNRPGKLLELSIGQGDEWARLCGFLGRREVPQIPFPHVNSKAQPLVPLGL